ncbi:alpha/beta hydrolase family [Holotrichia oblita]|uniref:Alpha/beta hydrolase family n=1 Tax=Holotrichia oblita TaxID=644536 RepID=A0ACB9SHW4_HOLOL|nr:alpha/beta hydrolase family [Holotrichia oblita]
MLCLKNSRNLIRFPYRTISDTTRIKDKEKIDPVDLAYASFESTDIGYGPTPVVIMHGLLGSKNNWNSLSKAFHQKTIPQRKIVAVDARNHGDSPHTVHHTYNHLVEDIKQLLERLKIPKACLLGHSMGGRAMMLFALKYPQFVDRLIIADISPVRISPNFKTTPFMLEALSKVSLPSNVPISTARVSADQQLLKVISNKGLRSFLVTNLVQKSDGRFDWRVNLPVLMASFSHLAVFPEAPHNTFGGPVLFVAGGSSDFIQKTDHPQIVKIFPNAEFQYIEGAGHWLHSEKPAEFLRLCLDFLNKEIK